MALVPISTVIDEILYASLGRSASRCVSLGLVERRRPGATADEKAMLVGWLTWQQRTVELKCAQLSEEDAHRAPVQTSPAMTIAGLVSHLTAVERDWLEGSFLGHEEALTNDSATAWSVSNHSLEQIVEAYRRQAARSRQIIEAHQLEQIEALAPTGAELVSLRWIVTHLIEETGRHLGHLDLLRELADGSRGQ